MTSLTPQPPLPRFVTETDLVAQWRERYGLHADPLQPGYFFAGGQRQHCLDQLKYLCHYSDRILVLQGTRGVGKTYLLKQLLAEEGERLWPVYVRPDQEFSAIGELVWILGRQLPVPPAPETEPAAVLTAFLDYCQELGGQGQRALIVVEQAEDIPEARLAMLYDLVRPALREGVLGLLLLASPALKKTLENKSEQQGHRDWFHVLELHPLSRKEATAYIQGRLTYGGWSGTPPLPEQALGQLLTRGKGIPGLLDQLAPGVLLRETKAARKSLLPAGQGRWVALLLALLVISFALVAFQYGREVSEMVTAEDAHIADDSPALRLRMASEPILLDLSQVSADVESGDSLAGALSTHQGEVGQAPDEQNSDIPDTVMPLSSSPGVAESALLTPSHEAPVVAAADVTPSAPMSELSGIQEKEAAVAGAEVRESKTKSESKVKETERAKVSPARAPVAKTPPPHPNYRDANWLRQQPSSAFTVQLLGSFNEATARTFIESQAKPSDYWYLKSRRQGRDWFIVLRGVHPSREAARAAVRGFPSDLRRLDPWIRQFEGIRQEVLGKGS